MKTLAITLALAAVTATAAQTQTASAQTSTQSQSGRQERVDAVLGALFGDRTGTGGSLETQWALGRFPLSQQRAQFETRIDGEARSGALSRSAAERAKEDYRALVELEARYGADRRFTVQERTELNARYEDVTRQVSEGGAAGGVSGGTSVADGQREFEARVDEGVRLRRLTRVQGTQLKADYAAVVRLESDYMRDRVLSARERDDLETRLDALDARVGDVNTGPGAGPVRPVEPAARLTAIARALPSSGLSAQAQAQLRVEHEDLTRLAAAYDRISPSRDDRAYLDRRLGDLEARVNPRR